MPYSRATLFEACAFLGRFLETHEEFENMLLRWELNGFIPELTGPVPDQLRKFFNVLRDFPDLQFDGRLIRELAVEEAAQHVYAGNPQAERFIRALARDGYSIDENRQLRSDLPQAADLPATDDAWAASPFQGEHLLRDRRQYPRLVPASPLLVHVGGHPGLLSNLCEGGLAVNSRFPHIQGEIFWMAVELPDSNSLMWTTAQTTWTNDSEKRTGLQFVRLPASSQQQLREWISAQATATVKEGPPTFRASAKDAQFNLAVVRPQPTLGGATRSGAWPPPAQRVRLLTGLFLTVTAFCSALIFLGYYLGSRSERMAGAITIATFLGPVVALLLVLFIVSKKKQIGEAIRGHRIERRIPVELGLELSSVDEPLSYEKALTKNASRHGARVVAEKSWRANDHVLVRLPRWDRPSRARITYCSGLPGDAFAMGLQFSTAVDDWGIPRGDLSNDEFSSHPYRK